jgi:serine/threonine-protein kinase
MNRVIDPRTDLYSLGVTVYEMLTGTVPFTGDSPVEIAMKHLSATPPSLSSKRPDIPKALDQVVLRALAKDPASRYQSAEEMDADLERISRGLNVSRETEEAATMVVRGVAFGDGAPTSIVPAEQATQVRGRPATEEYFDYSEPVRTRSIWPWLLAILLVAGAVIAGFYVYRQIQDQLNEAKPVGVPYLVGIKEANAVDIIHQAGLETDPDHIKREPNDTQPKGYVFAQSPNQGDRVAKGSSVELLVSTGKAQVVVPGVIGRTSEDAVAAITRRKLEADVHNITSSKPQGTVIAQDPKGGAKVDENTKVRINVSNGPRPIGIPDVRGSSFETATSQLQALGFAVARQEAESDEPAGNVIAQSPEANTFAGKGSTVTLTVSKGPQTTGVPSVEGTDEQTARSTLEDSGFKVRVKREDTPDEGLNGSVLSQDPPAGTEAKPGSKVTIVVGRYKAPPPADTTTATTTTVPPE